MRKKVDHEWNSHAEKNAKHICELHILTGQPEKAAKALKGIPTLTALEFLYEKAHTYRYLPAHKKALTAIQASKLIKRKSVI